MRVKKLENVEQLLNIKDDECYIWKMDYEITDWYNRILDENGYFIRTEYPYCTIKIFTQRFLDDINKNLELKFVLNEEIKVTKDIIMDIRNYIKDKKYTGSIGSRSIS